METKKVQLAFYPILWERHAFDGMNSNEIMAEFEKRGIDQVTFIDWGEHDIDEDNESVVADMDADLYNDFDDCRDYDEQTENSLLEGVSSVAMGNEEGFIMNHWCIPIVTDTPKKKRYNVRVYLHTFVDYEIEAENEAKAKEIAEDIDWETDGLYMEQVQANMVLADDTDVFEVENI